MGTKFLNYGFSFALHGIKEFIHGCQYCLDVRCILTIYSELIYNS